MAIVATSDDKALLVAIHELAEYLGEDPVATSFNVGNSFFTAAEKWRLERPKTPDEIARYYRDTQALCHQLVFANYGIPHELALIRHVAEVFGGQERVLDLGAGIGSFLLALECRDKYHADFDGHVMDFARWRYRRVGQDVHMLALFSDYLSRGPVFGGGFDGVLCTEVLEHAPDPEALVEYLAKLVRPGGKLLATVSFEDADGMIPQHLNTDIWTNETFIENVFPAHGFRALGDDVYLRV